MSRTLPSQPVATAGERAVERRRVAWRLVGELKPHRGGLIVLLAFILVGAVAQATGPWLIGRAIDRDILSGDRAGLNRSMLLLLAVYGAGVFATRGQIWRVGTIGQQVLASLRARLFDRLLRLPLGYFDRRPVGDLMSRVINDVDTLGQLLTQGLTQVLGSLFALVGILIAMLALNWRLALASYAIIPVMFATTTFFSGRARRAFRTARETTGSVTAELEQGIAGMREAQAFNRAEANIARFRRGNAANRDANISAVGVTSAFAPAIDVLSTLALAIVIGYGGYLAFDGDITIGLLAAFLTYAQQFFRPIQLASTVYTQGQAALAGAERMYAILDAEQEPLDAPDAVTLGEARGEIEFEQVRFAYGDGREALRGVSFRVAPGQTVALVGPTGAGKTTIANLIPRFYDVAAGAVRVDGHDVRAVTRASLRAQLAIVLQEPFLTRGSIAENIAWGRRDATRAEVEAAARVAGADEFIRLLPAGYDTSLGDAGGRLSQGQRQLLAIARAVLANPRILILDEATSNVDTRSEAAIQGALAALLAGRTSVVIAHRLSTIRHADLILVVDDGRIREQGTHAELLARDGLYADLYRRQAAA